MLKMKSLPGFAAVLLFLCLVHPCIGDTDGKTVVLFDGGVTEIPDKKSTGAGKVIKPHGFRIPALVGGVFNNKEFLAVLCDAHYGSSADSTFIEPAVKTSYGNYKQWSAAENFAKKILKKEDPVLGNVTAVMKDDKIYAIATSFEKSPSSKTAQNGITTGWDTTMFVGTVINSTDSSADGMTVRWDKEISLKSLLQSSMLDSQLVNFTGGVGNGVVMKNGTIVLPIQITNTKGVVQASIIYSTDDGSTWQMGGRTYYSTFDGSVVEFGEGKLFFFVRFDWGAREVYESDDMGTTWKESALFMEVWGNQPSRNSRGSQGSVITAPVDGEDVLLFLHPLNTDESETRDTLQLWVSDGQRISCIGTISEKDKGEKTGNSILAQIGDNLYVTHEINPPGENQNKVNVVQRGKLESKIAISSLPQLFESAKNTVRAWRQLDASLQTKNIPTNELVGFLGNTKKETAWADMYNCVNATVKGGESVDGGFRFSGKAESGAKWPVRSQGQNQLYRFAEREFTLAASITIHSTSGAEAFLLLGASKDAQQNKIFIGMGFTQDKHWYTVSANNSKTFTKFLFEVEKEYHIAITFTDVVSFVYVNGVNITNGTQIDDSYSYIDHFYMGSVGKQLTAEGSVCTIKNVMLFKKSLEQKEIAQMLNLRNEGEQDKTTATEKHTGETNNHKSVLTLKEKKASAAVDQKVNNKNGGGKGVDHYLSENQKQTLEKHLNSADGTAIVLTFVTRMCFVCSIIALVGV